MNGSLQYLYDRLSVWPDRPANLRLGQPSGNADGFFLEPVQGRAYENGQECRLYDVTLRLRPDGDDDMLQCAALCDSMVAFACSGGAEIAVSPERTTAVSPRHSDGGRDFTARLSCLAEPSTEANGIGADLPELRLVTSGRSIKVGGDSVFGLVSVKGLESAEYFASLSPNGASDGSFIRGLSSPKRVIEFTLAFRSDEQAQTRREYLISALAPDTTCVLHVKRGVLRRKISAAVKNIVYETDTLSRRIKATVSLVCPDPYFTDEDEHLYYIRRSIPLLTFPFNSMAGAGVTASLQRTDYNVAIDNTGHSDAGFTAVLRSLSGDTVNPSLTSDGRVIRLLDSTVVGDVYTISTVEGDKRIEKNGESFYAFDRRSEFFTLSKGGNIITVGADRGESATEAVISCAFRYFGI